MVQTSWFVHSSELHRLHLSTLNNYLNIIDTQLQEPRGYNQYNYLNITFVTTLLCGALLILFLPNSFCTCFCPYCCLEQVFRFLLLFTLAHLEFKVGLPYESLVHCPSFTVLIFLSTFSHSLLLECSLNFDGQLHYIKLSNLKSNRVTSVFEL